MVVTREGGGGAENRQLEPGTMQTPEAAPATEDVRSPALPALRGEQYKCLKIVARPIQWDTESRTVC